MKEWNLPFKYIDPDKAPDPPAKKTTGKASEYIEMIENLPEDKVAEVVPDEGQSLRGIKVSVGRIASKRGLKIQSWDDGTKVYVKRLS
jgi:hypothetical protein